MFIYDRTYLDSLKSFYPQQVLEYKKSEKPNHKTITTKDIFSEFEKV